MDQLRSHMVFYTIDLIRTESNCIFLLLILFLDFLWRIFSKFHSKMNGLKDSQPEKKMDISLTRCPWVDLEKPDYIAYHDAEWGVPVHDDRLLFEFLTLESAQAGLSWYTVLRKRDSYRKAFDGFDPERVARFDDRKLKALLQNPGIIRNRRKIQAIINNARRFLEVQDTFGSFDAYIWRFVEGRPIIHEIRSNEAYPSISLIPFPVAIFFSIL